MGFSSCGTWAQQLWFMGSRAQAQQLWRTGFVAPRHAGLPGPGLEPVSPALAGGFLTTLPPGKPPLYRIGIADVNMNSLFLVGIHIYIFLSSIH